MLTNAWSSAEKEKAKEHEVEKENSMALARVSKSRVPRQGSGPVAASQICRTNGTIKLSKRGTPSFAK